METSMVIAVILGIILSVAVIIFLGETIEKFGENRNIGFVRVFGVLLGFCGKAAFLLILAIILIAVIAQVFPGSGGVTVTPPVYTR